MERRFKSRLRIGNAKQLASFIASLLALTAGTLVLAGTMAQAQFFQPQWRGPVIVDQDGMVPELIGSREIRRILFRYGYRVRGRLRRNGRVYVANTRDRRGRSWRIVVDGLDGDILERFAGVVPRPPRNVGRRQTRRNVVPEGSAAGPRELVPRIKANRKKSRKATASKLRRKKQRTARRPSRAVTSRPLAPLVRPAKIARKPIKARSVKPAVANAAPPMIPQGPKVRPEPRVAATPAVPPKTAGAIKQSAPPLLLPPDKPAPLKLDRLKRSAVLSGKTIEGPSVSPNRKGAGSNRVNADVRSAADEGSTSTRAILAPLDDPGQRRDIEKPVAVAPLE